MKLWWFGGGFGVVMSGLMFGTRGNMAFGGFVDYHSVVLFVDFHLCGLYHGRKMNGKQTCHYRGDTDSRP